MAESFLYNPQSNYGYKGMPGPWGKAKSYLDTYPGGLDAEQDPQGYFTHVIGTQGLGGMDNRSNIARGMYGRLQDAYGAARLKNNALTWKTFLQPMNFNQLIDQTPSSQKGIQASSVSPYDVRWVPR